DPKEAGERAHLNLGHTLGHAIESVSNYALSHGQAVSIGLVAAVRLARRLGYLEVDFEQRLLDLLAGWQLPTRLERDYGWDEVLEVMTRDKKNRDGRLTFVLPHRPGQVEVVRGVDPARVEEVYRGLCP
ncbi:MAG: 3-dehydroquinate synthase, partial [Candidatus Eremiobacteraeota bacterium]|nr:3-dehydroquinate synthase [Candidatus Eremiobacteraeota bacterium]